MKRKFDMKTPGARRRLVIEVALCADNGTREDMVGTELCEMFATGYTYKDEMMAARVYNYVQGKEGD